MSESKLCKLCESEKCKVIRSSVQKELNGKHEKCVFYFCLDTHSFACAVTDDKGKEIIVSLNDDKTTPKFSIGREEIDDLENTFLVEHFAETIEILKKARKDYKKVIKDAKM